MTKVLVSINENYQKETEATRDGFGTGLVKLATENSSVVGLCADLTESTRMENFAKLFPERFFELGVAEQNMIGLAAGLALSGKIPFAASYAVFSPGRSWDQIRVSVCYSKANVKIVGAHAGLSVGPDGATHQALEDIAIMRVLPHMTVVVPADSAETEKATKAIGLYTGPSYLRLGREKVSSITTSSTPFKLGQATQLLAGCDVTIIACGQMVARAFSAAQKLAGHIDVAVINMHTIKPLDYQAVIQAAKTTGAIVTAEEHQITGGLGSAVAEVLVEHCPVPLIRVGVKDSFGQSGPPEVLMNHYGLLTEDIIEAVKEIMERKDAR